MTAEGKLIVLIGPTAVGKTKMSIELAKAFNGEIISGDSMQIYKKLDIGTAKIKTSEMEGIPHHLIDLLDPHESFSVAQFQELVREKISDIVGRGKQPFIVGGTGLYIQSVLYDFQFSEAPSDEAFRQRMEMLANEKGNQYIHEHLINIDPDSANRIHPNNLRRVIRALEVFHCTGKTMTELVRTQSPKMLFDTAVIGLTMEREKLYERINQRVDLMINEGLLHEVESLYRSGLRNCQSIQGIGYKELYQYFDGDVPIQEAVEKLKQNSRRYAKRQLTWFRNKMDVEWFDMTSATSSSNEFTKKNSEISAYIEGKLKIKSNTY
ncbi:tRNA (adenosine(37)-N6)-dimethylallyltransferase MiaA [Niallia sp. XMNu-256]|uniref:tRNA (adenosine(37)-N6)-dimethylallyltransferase MiaA n=1 Tax=Niallia sp. XMNu-256 TaxID=3082444 RepID=UPI0030CF68A1